MRTARARVNIIACITHHLLLNEIRRLSRLDVSDVENCWSLKAGVRLLHVMHTHVEREMVVRDGGGGERWAAGGAAKPAVATPRDGSGQTYSTTSTAHCASATSYAVHLGAATHCAYGSVGVRRLSAPTAFERALWKNFF